MEHRKITVIARDNSLATDSVPTDALVAHAADFITEEHILWTHVTSPFYDENCYNTAIDTYFKNITNFDSLMSVDLIKNFIWFKGRPLNYDRSFMKWPATQTLDPIKVINSACFLTSRDVYIQEQDRIGKSVYSLQTDPLNAIDIDWQEDWDFAEMIWNLMY